MDSVYLFNNGTNYQSWKLLGANPAVENGQHGWRFSVWAPRARAVSLVGGFNNWDAEAHWLLPVETSGLWSIFLPGDYSWQRYKFAVHTADGRTILKADPFAKHSETRPSTASICYAPDNYTWGDLDFLYERAEATANAPLNIYEVHLGSWRRYPDGNFYSYREMADQLAPYLQDMGFNAVELLPVTEYPLDASWGYQVSGYFAPTSRYGSPADFKYFVDQMHRHGILVIMDWVPSHFPRDEFGLFRFDGQAAFEPADPDRSDLQQWGTVAFDYGRREVHSFLISSAWYWLSEYHIDGLRMDAVSSMIYLSFDRPDYLKNEQGGGDNLEALDFLKHMNSVIRAEFPSALLIAEESTAYPAITHRTEDGGLGFTHKWNMGWMHDTLDFMSLDYIMRPGSYNKITFSMTYAYSERYVLAFSHDEVVHGKKSLLDRMPGDLWRKFASYRTLLMYQMAHPGAKLNFMGFELGTFIEWRFYEELEWFMLQYDNHRKIQNFVRSLNHIYLENPSFWEEDDSWDGFEWLQADDPENTVYIFCRHAPSSSQSMLCIFNMTPAVLSHYTFHVPRAGRWKVRLCSDDTQWGGSGYLGDTIAGRVLETRPAGKRDAHFAWYRTALETMNPEYSDPGGDSEAVPDLYCLDLDLPPLAAVYLELI